MRSPKRKPCEPTYYQKKQTADEFASDIIGYDPETFRHFVASYMSSKGINMSTTDGKKSYLLVETIRAIDKIFANNILDKKTVKF